MPKLILLVAISLYSDFGLNGAISSTGLGVWPPHCVALLIKFLALPMKSLVGKNQHYFEPRRKNLNYTLLPYPASSSRGPIQPTLKV